MTEENISAVEEEIFQIRSKLSELRRRQAEFEEMARAEMEKRDKIHERIKEIKERNSEYLNRMQEVRNNIAEMRARLDEVVKKINELRTLKENLLSQHVGDNLKGYSGYDVMRRIRELEERIETSILRPEEERKLYEELRNLTKILADVQKREDIAEKVKEYNSQLAPLVEEARKLREQIRLKREELNSLKETIQAVKDAIQELKPEADKHHQAYLDYKNKAAMADAESILLTSRLVELQEFVKKRREVELKTREYMLKEKVKSRAIEKLAHGEKLTFDEMKVLMEDEEAWAAAVRKPAANEKS
jgi:uncharacterized coiled-coil DUF342 family protein